MKNEQTAFEALLSTLDPADLALLTPTEQTELLSLFIEDRKAKCLKVLPLSVRIKLLESLRRFKATGGDDRHYKIGDLDMPEDLKAQINQTAQTGTWPGEPDPPPWPTPSSANAPAPVATGPKPAPVEPVSPSPKVSTEGRPSWDGNTRLLRIFRSR